MPTLTTALDMTPQQIAATLGVTLRTVRRWIRGTHKPAPWNRIKLNQLLDRVWREFNASNTRWNARRDNLLHKLSIMLMSPAEHRQWQAERNQMRAAFTQNGWTL